MLKEVEILILEIRRKTKFSKLLYDHHLLLMLDICRFLILRI